MKKITWIPLLASSLLCIAGCIVGSPEPWLGDSTSDATADITGAWTEARAGQEPLTMWFEPQIGKTGVWVARVDRLKEQWKYQVTVHRVDGVHFLQVAPADIAKDTSPFAVVPAHLLLRMDRDAQGLLTLHQMRLPAARKLLEKDPLQVLDTGDNGYILMGEPTEKLSAWITRHAQDPDLFAGDPLYVLKRIHTKPAPAPAPAH